MQNLLMNLGREIAVVIILAIAPAFIARNLSLKICEFRSRWLPSYAGFALGFSLAAVCSVAIEIVEVQYIQSDTGTAWLLGWAAQRATGLIAILGAVRFCIRDAERVPISWGTATVLSLLTMVWLAPLGLVAWFATAWFDFLK